MKKVRRDAARSRKENLAMGIAWYRREQWQRLREISADTDELEDSYDEWLAVVSNAIERLKSQGLNPIKVNIDTEDLLAWCRSRDLPVDGKARAQFTTEKVRQILKEPLP